MPLPEPRVCPSCGHYLSIHSPADSKCLAEGCSCGQTVPEIPASSRAPLSVEECAGEIARKGYHWLGHGEPTAVKAISEILSRHFARAVEQPPLLCEKCSQPIGPLCQHVVWFDEDGTRHHRHASDCTAPILNQSSLPGVSPAAPRSIEPKPVTYRMLGIEHSNPDSPVTCNCNFDGGHEATCHIVAAHKFRYQPTPVPEVPFSLPLITSTGVYVSTERYNQLSEAEKSAEAYWGIMQEQAAVIISLGGTPHDAMKAEAAVNSHEELKRLNAALEASLALTREESTQWFEKTGSMLSLNAEMRKALKRLKDCVLTEDMGEKLLAVQQADFILSKTEGGPAVGREAD